LYILEGMVGDYKNKIKIVFDFVFVDHKEWPYIFIADIS